jgi:hypothetical protein
VRTDCGQRRTALCHSSCAVARPSFRQARSVWSIASDSIHGARREGASRWNNGPATFFEVAVRAFHVFIQAARNMRDYRKVLRTMVSAGVDDIRASHGFLPRRGL